MKLSNKILLGGFCLPVILVIVFVIFMSINSTDDLLYQFGSDVMIQNAILN